MTLTVIRKSLCFLLTLALTLTAFTSAAVFSASAATSRAGDVTGDGTVTTMDSLRLYAHCSGSQALTASQLTAADYNHDGTVNTSDAVRLFRHTGGQLKAQVALSTPSEEELEVFRLINEERAANGLDPVQYATPIQGFADIRADELIISFSHTRPDGRSCFTVFDDHDSLGFFAGGENVAIGHSSPEEVMEGWMNSEGHRANILNPNFNYVIVGSVKLPEGNPYYYRSGCAWVQLFMY